MAECLTCLQANPIPRCINSLIIGAVTADTDVIIRLQTFFNRTEQLESTSASDGTVTADLSQIELANGVYQISIYDENYEEKLMISVGASQSDCIEVMVMDGEIDSVTLKEKV